MNSKLKFFSGIDVFALGPSVALYYALFYYPASLLILLGVSFPFIPYHEVPWRALGLTSIGLIALIVGYYIPIGRILIKRIPNVLTGEWNIRRAELVFWALFLGGLFAKAVRILGGGYGHITITEEFISSSFFSAVGFLDWFAYIAIAFVFVSYYSLIKKQLPFTRWRWYAWGAILLEIVYALPTCARAGVVVPLAIVLLVRAYLIKFDWKFVGAIVFAVLIMFPIGNFCRSPGTLEYRGILDDEGVDIGQAGRFAVHSTVSRTDYAQLIEKIIDADIPLEYGRNFWKFFASLGPPRFLWHDKPIISEDGNAFGRQIGVLAPDNKNTFVGRTLVGDWYIQFGIFGVLAGMFIMGVLWRIMYEYLIKLSGKSPSGIFMYSIVWIQVIRGLEDSIVPVYAGLVKFFVLLFIINYFIKKRNSP